MLVAELQSAQSKLAFYIEKAETSVSRELYDAKEAENAALRAEIESLHRIHEEELKARDDEHAAKMAEMETKHKADVKEYEEIQALLRTENTDFKTLWQFWQGHHFGASSETMTDMMEEVVGRLPEDRMGLLADILGVVDFLNRTEGNPDSVKLPTPASRQSKVPKGPQANASSRESSAKNHKKPKCVDVRGVFPADLSDLPPNCKVIMRNGKPDEIVIEILYMDKPKAYSKKFTVARCNVPGHDPMSSKYPPRLFGKSDMHPSFASFVLEMKFGYNIPESRIVEMLLKAGCTIPQPTLNRWIHEVIDGLYEVLMPEMEKAVKESRFTHNDETRILVRSQEKDGTSPSYKTEYIHGILSPEANLFMMLYKEGSRAHTVQLDIFRDSNIIAFIADRCPLYTALVTALDCHPLIRGACWIHFRRYLLHAFMQDRRLEPMVHLIARLFAAERIISQMKDLTETKRVSERKRMCKPLVDAMFTFMQRVKDAGDDYGVLARRAADYLLNDREGFRAFLGCALLEIGNNAVERCFRSIAKGRENWLQCGSHEAAKHTAFMYSLVESCSMNGLDFGLYIETVLNRILDGDTDYAAMLPNRIVLPKEGEKASAA